VSTGARGQDAVVPEDLEVVVESVRDLVFDDGGPVRAASAVAAFGDGWLVAQDDATHAAHLVQGSVRRLRVVPPVEGHDVFSAAAGTKHLKPDVEAACPVDVVGTQGVLLLGSGSTAARMRAALVTVPSAPQVVVADLTPLYATVARRLDRPPEQLNLEGACLVPDGLRWFARGNLAAGVCSASVDVDLAALLDCLYGSVDCGQVPVRNPVGYALGEVAGVGLTVTDALALPDGRVLVSAAAEDTPNAVDDGPVVASAVALLDGTAFVASAALPRVDGQVAKVEGLALVAALPDGVRLLAVVDDDDPDVPSKELTLRVRLGQRARSAPPSTGTIAPVR
jgi:hypothetical protein